MLLSREALAVGPFTGALAHRLWELVCPSTIVHRKAAATTGQAQGVVSHGADPLLSLPVATPFDAHPRAHCMVHCVPEQLLSWGRRGMRLLHRSTEEQPKFRSHGSEIRSRSKRQIELQTSRQQKHAINGRTTWQIE